MIDCMGWTDNNDRWSFIAIVLSETLETHEIVFTKPLKIFNCSQTKFQAIMLVLLSFSDAIFPLADFLPGPFDFLSPKSE